MAVSLVLVIITAIIFGTVMFAMSAKAFFGYLSSRQQPAQESSSLTESELHALIQNAVAEATQPLAERIASLEQHTAKEALPPARPDMLDDADGYSAETAPEAPHRSVVH